MKLVGGSDEPTLLVQPSEHPVPPGAIHLDLRPDDFEACRERALELGAREVDIGQTGDEEWVVMADPGGNLFCILRPEGDATHPGTPTPID